jgi:uncharacterized membrane protein
VTILRLRGAFFAPAITAMRQNMVWDGLFHLATLGITIVGVFMLWSEGHHGGIPITASGLHEPVYDWRFRAFGGVGLIAIGWVMLWPERLSRAAMQHQ